MIKFSEAEMRTAVRVAVQSRMVKNWVRGEMRAFEVDPNSPEGKIFIKKESVRAARRILEQ